MVAYRVAVIQSDRIVSADADAASPAVIIAALDTAVKSGGVFDLTMGSAAPIAVPTSTIWDMFVTPKPTGVGAMPMMIVGYKPTVPQVVGQFG